VFLASWIKFKTTPKVRHWQQETYQKAVIVERPPEEHFDYTKGMDTHAVYNRLSKISGQLDNNSWGLKTAQGVRPEVITGYNPGDERILSKIETESIEAKKDASWQNIIDTAKQNEAPRTFYIPVTQDASGQFQSAIPSPENYNDQPLPQSPRTEGDISLDEEVEFRL
jgi:hypothetical protein